MNDLTEAANILDTSEFEVLRRAYLHWYGKLPAESELGSIFADWMSRQQLPAWARHYVARVIREFEQELRQPCRCFALLWLWLVRARRSMPAGPAGRKLRA